MDKKFLTKTLFLIVFGLASQSYSMAPDSGVNNWASNIKWGVHRVVGSAAKTIVQNPITSSIGAYYLVADRDAIRNNTFWSGIFGACLLASFVKNVFYPNSSPKNFMVKTLWDNPFFSFCAGHMLLFHRDKIKNYPIESMIVGGTLLYDLASNYHKQPTQEDDLAAVYRTV